MVVGFIDAGSIGLNVGAAVNGDVGSMDGECEAAGIADGLTIGSVVGADVTTVAAGGAIVGEGLTGALVRIAGGLVSMVTGGIGPLGALDGTSLGELLGKSLGTSLGDPLGETLREPAGRSVTGALVVGDFVAEGVTPG